MRHLSLVLALVLWLPASATPDPGRARLVRVLGHYAGWHATPLVSLVSLEPTLLFGVDARGESIGWNLATSLPLGPFAGKRCALNAPTAQLPSRDGVVSVDPKRGFWTCAADGSTAPEAPPLPLTSEAITALAARRDGDTKVVYVWGDEKGNLGRWRSGDAASQTTALAGGPVLALSVLKDGTVLALGGDGRLARWDTKGTLAKGARLIPPACPLDVEPCASGSVRVTFAALDAEGQRAVISSAASGYQGYGIGEARTQAFSLQTQKALWTRVGLLATAGIPLDEHRLALGVSATRPPDIVGPSRTEIVDLSNGNSEGKPAENGAVLSVAFSSDGKRIAAGRNSGMLELWDAMTGDPIAQSELHVGPLVSLAFSPDSTRLAVQPQDGPAHWLDGQTARPEGPIPGLTSRPEPKARNCPKTPKPTVDDEGEPGDRELAFSPDGKHLLATFAESHCASFDPCGACAESDTPAWVSVPEGKIKERWEQADRPLLSACSAALGAPVTSWDAGGAAVWSAQGKVTARLGLPGSPATRCAVGEGVVALLSEDGVVLHPRIGGAPRRVRLAGAVALAVSPDGRFVLVAGRREVRLLSAPDGETLEVLPLKQMGDAPRALAFSRDSEAFAVGTQRGVVLEFGLLVANPPRNSSHPN